MSEVTICNLALSHLGDTAAVVSISPPDPSVQAQLCARFYYFARNALLEMASWSFATKRVQPAELTVETVTDADGNANQTWCHSYAMPSDMLNGLAVISPDAPDDYEGWLGPVEKDLFPPYPQGYLPVPGAPVTAPQPFAMETQADGTQIILTNVANAVLRYTAVVSDTTKFTPLFTLALSYLLASMLAGPIIKGDESRAVQEQMLQVFEATKGQATASDANQRKTRVEPAPSWIRGR
ncbi:MAG TPA: hypothetical protein VGR47_06005 [Terracidiphilus sp.]|nr:hypothetical protein [Terracidiphilus sp.]